MASLFQSLKERKLGQWTLAYLAVAWLGLEAFDLIAQQFEWPSWVRQGSTVVLLFGLLITVVLAWHHGERGRQRVSGGEVMVVTLLVALAGASVTFLRGRGQEQITAVGAEQAFALRRDTPPERSVAVLPCADRSQGGDQEYFASGLAEELTTQLAAIRDLRVAARTSAFSFKDSSEDIAEIAASLNVRNVLECSVRREGDRVRISAQLVDASEGFERWSRSYDRDVESILAVHGEIALAIADALEAELREDERERLFKRGTESREAYDLYLRGLNLNLRSPWSAENQFRALEYAEASVAADSTFASAWALLSMTHSTLGQFLVVPPRDAYPPSERAALRAVALDDDLPYAHVALGWVKLTYTFDWLGAEHEFRRAIALAPSDGKGYHSLNFALAVQGEFEEALVASEEAIALDPLALWPRVGRFELNYKMGRFDEIIDQVEAQLELEPNDPISLIQLALAQGQTGALDEARANLVKAEAMAQGDPTLTLMAGMAYATAGDTAAVLERLDRLEEEEALVSPGLVGVAYAALGDADRAFEWLNLAADEYDSIVFSLHYPEFRWLRTDPRFGELLDRLGLPREAYP